MINHIKQEAKAKGLKRYFDGKPCLRGHVADRLINGTCTVCHHEQVRKVSARNPEERRRTHKRWRDKHGREWGRKYRGMPEATRPESETCENCGSAPTGRGMHLDHDHKTGIFRGWLCQKCNHGLGLLDDSIEGLERALRYLKRAQQ